ncbi:MAG: inositol monophosphatase [Pseudomonadales bacterium]|nr:inositol monophosphatase [Pseudomonadales bacterium]
MQPMLNIALRAARKAATHISRSVGQLDRIEINSKGVNDFVTEVDRTAEKIIISELQRTYPEHAILGEESGFIAGSQAEKAGQEEYQWVIDPLDGTTNFIHGLPHFCVSVGCLRNGRMEHAVIIDPIRNEEFCASRGDGAQLNGKRIRVSKRASLDGSLLATGFPFKPHQSKHLDDHMAIFKKLSSMPAGIRRNGSAALDLAYVAAGRYDGYWEMGLKEWDIAAGALLVLEAGGLVSDFKGGASYYQSGNIICGSPKCFKGLLATVQPHFIENPVSEDNT